MAACQSWICFPLLQCHVFMVYVLLCWGVFFFCSQTVLQMEHSLGVKNFFFSSSLSSCKKLYFLNTLSPVLSTPLSYVCCVCMDRLMANFAGTCTSDNKGLLLLLLLKCGKVWKPSPTTRHHPPALRLINNLLMTWMSFIVDLNPPPHTHPDHLSTQPLTPPLSPSPLHLHSRTLKKMCTRSSERTREERHQAQIVWQPENLCWPAGPHLFTDLQ